MLQVSIFASLFLNYVYSTWLQVMLGIVAIDLVEFADGLGMEIHFMRFLWWALFKQDTMSHRDKMYAWNNRLIDNLTYDFPCLAFIILPMFCMALHFYTANSKEFYNCKYQALVAPLAFIPLFLFTNWDVAFMSLHVLFLNGYCCYYLLDHDAYAGYS